MKAGKAFLAALILMAFPTVGFGQKETASKDDNGIRGLLLHDAVNLQTRRWLDDGAGGALVSFSAGASSLADQGISGVSDADPWNVMIRSGAGTELGLAASPFAINIFDAASNVLGVTANPLVVDLGVNNDVTITSGTVTANAGTGTFNIQATAALPGSVRLSDGTSFYEATTPADTQPISAATLPLPSGATKESTLSDVELNTDTAQTASEPVVISVGTTPTLIFSASTTRRLGFIQNSGTSPVFLGKAAVTTATGEILPGSNVANDGKGSQAIAEHGDTVFGIVASGTVNVRVSQVSD